jgi:DNA-binding transcriptional LysR family regulator
MTFSQLEIFVIVAELGGFTAAAGRLGITQSAVSHAMRQLETAWGVTLLARGPSGVTVTETGQTLLVRVRELLGVSDAIRQEISATRGLHRGSLRIGSFGPTASLQLLPHILDVFGRQYPEIEVLVDEGEDHEVSRWLEERRVDVGFVVLPDERFDTVALVQDQLVALLPAAHPLATKRAVSLAELCDWPFVLTRAGSAGLVEGLFQSAGLRPRVTQRYSQILTILKTVERGAGVSILADLAVPPEVMAMCHGLVKKPLTPVIRRSVGLAVRSRKSASLATEAFLKLARSVARSQPWRASLTLQP